MITGFPHHFLSADKSSRGTDRGDTFQFTCKYKRGRKSWHNYPYSIFIALASKKKLHNYRLIFGVSVPPRIFFVATRAEQSLRYLYLLDVALRRFPAFEHVVDGMAVVVSDGAIGERQQSLDDLDAVDGAGYRRDRPVQGRPAVRVRQVGRRAMTQQQIDHLDVAHVGRAVQRRRFHAAGTRVHVRPVPQQNLAHADVPAPRCVMQRRVAGGVRHVDEDTLPQQPIDAIHVTL